MTHRLCPEAVGSFNKVW